MKWTSYVHFLITNLTSLFQVESTIRHQHESNYKDVYMQFHNRNLTFGRSETSLIALYIYIYIYIYKRCHVPGNDEVSGDSNSKE
jgi:hypothetical protein